MEKGHRDEGAAWRARPWRIAGGAVAAVAMGLVCAGPSFAGVLDQIKKTATIRIGYRTDARPFSFESDGKPTGYMVELCGMVAQEMKANLGLSELRVEPVVVGAEDRITAVSSGKVDLLCEATAITLHRREAVSFSIPTFVTGISVLLLADAPPFLRRVLSGHRSDLPPREVVVQALRDRTFGVRSGTPTEAWLNGRLKTLALNARVEAVGDEAEGLKKLRSGALDAYFGDRAALLEAVAHSGQPSGLALTDRFFTYEPYALALPRGDEGFRLAVDRALSRIYADAAVLTLFTKYFGPPSPTAQMLFLMTSIPE